MRIHNGVLLMTYLAANYKSGAPISLDEIAKREKISQKFLEEIAAIFRKADMIEGQRGQKGGYVLTKNPKKTSIASVIEALEGPVVLVDCLADEVECPLGDCCSNRLIWKRVQDKVTDTLIEITLSDLISDRYLI